MEQFDVQPLYRALVENAQDILGVLTPAGVIVTVSPAVRRVLGLSPERLRGRHWIDQIHPDDRALARRWLASCSADDEHHQQVQVRAGRPPLWRVVQLAGVSVTEDAYTNRIVFSARDATDEVAATSLLAEREARFRSAFHDAPIGKVMLNAAGMILDSNRAFAKIIDRWSTELEGENFLEIFRDAGGVEALSEAWSRAGEESRGEVAVTFDRRGRAAHLRILFAPVAAKGEAHALAQVQDFSARIEAELALERNLQNLRKSNKRLQEMAWMASHDLKEPLRGMVGSLQLILRRHKELISDTERETAQQAIAQAKALRERLDALEAEVGHGRSGSSEMLAFGDLVNEWNQVHALEIEQARVSIEYSELPSFRTDRRVGASFQSILDQVLAWNAVLADASKVAIKGIWKDGQWQLSVDTAAPGGLQVETLSEPGGELFGLRSEIEERGAELAVAGGDGRLVLSLQVAPD